MKAVTDSLVLDQEEASDKALFLRIMLRIMPILFIGYIIAYIDRVNVGFAKLQMLDDLNFSAAVYGFGSGIFFLGFILFEIPSNLILHRVGARVWLARIMLTWGIIAIATLFVQTPLQFYISRFLLGAAEAGFVPGAVYYLSLWFPPNRRGRVFSILITATAVGGIVVGPLCGWIMEHFAQSQTLRNWQWLFLLQGLPALVFAVVFWRLLPEHPDKVDWLSRGERERLAQLNDNRQQQQSGHERIGQVLSQANVWLLAVTLLSVNLGIYSAVFWAPTIIKESGIDDLATIGYVSALPYIAAALFMLVLGRSSDRFQERRWHIASSSVIAAIGLLLVASEGEPMLRIGGVILATGAFIGTTPLIWATAGNYMSGRGAAVGLAMMNTIAALGGLFGPYLMGLAKDLTGSTNLATNGLAVAALLGSLAILRLPKKAAAR
ncbi:MFS transporter [Pseudomonas putida]|uniref:MFS transporter n=1 Tax=Pseudomonas putida TaxID=303 RepID=UPI00383BB9F9